MRIELGGYVDITARELRRRIGPPRGLASLRRIVDESSPPAGIFFKAALVRDALKYLPPSAPVRVEFDPFAKPGDLQPKPRREDYGPDEDDALVYARINYDMRTMPPIVMRITSTHDGRVASFVAQNPPEGFEVVE